MNSDNNCTAIITNIQRYCLDDGPGIRTTVFLKGCPLRCVWCHNPETYTGVPECMQRDDRCTGCGRCIEVCPMGARSLVLTQNEKGEQRHIAHLEREFCMACGKCAEVCPAGACEICGVERTAESIIEEVARDMIFYKSSGGGMTISGGECAANPEFTLELIRLAKERGISVMLETCGYGMPEFFLEAAELGVGFLYDIKEIHSDRHKQLTGVENELILSNLEAIMDKGADIVIRIPLIPGVNDSDEELSDLASYLSKRKGRFRAAQIMPYHAMGTGKAASLGKTQITIESDLTANDCASSKPRWKEIFERYGVELI